MTVPLSTENNTSSEPTFYPSDTFDDVVHIEPRHWWFRSRNGVINWVLKKFIPTPAQNILEVGCGTGFVLESLRVLYPDANLQGAEFFSEGLKHAESRVPTATFMQLDARKMDATEKYDLIGAFDVIEHIHEDHLVLENLANALTRGGRLLLTVPQHMWLWSSIDERACHVRRYERKELLSKIKRANLTPLYATSFVSLLLPLMWLSRLQRKTKEDNYRSEYTISPILNSILETVMNIELFLLKTGFKFPAGGSLLVLAQKP